MSQCGPPAGWKKHGITIGLNNELQKPVIPQ